MDLNYTAEEKAFRDEVRTYLAENLSPGFRPRLRRINASTRRIWSNGITS